MDSQALERIGLTEGEAKVYLALLKLGETTAGPIVDASQVTRSKIYDILERLAHKGLVGYVTRESTKYFCAADPSNLLEYLNARQHDLDVQRNTITALLPKLAAEYLSRADTRTAEVFLGMRGMQTAFNVLAAQFDSGTPYYAFGAGKGERVEQIQAFFNKLHQQREQNQVKTFIIFNESSRGLFDSQERSPLVEVRYLLASTPAAINIYKGCTIIAILVEMPITVLIRNQPVADSFRSYFQAMWRIANS